MPRFYTEQVQIVRPVKVTDKYNPDGEMLSWEGAQRLPVPFRVEVQPRTQYETDENGTRVATRTVWWLCTPRGKNLDVEPTDRIAHAGRDLDVVGEIKRWPAPEFESGVDHVELTLEYKNG
ncbi:head-to-tail stopper [Gordonia phage Archis]|nr:head-to-tail stopper [Gordonia phage Archis]